MASIATCPQCARQLAVPESATSADHAECPLCEATFLLANVVQLAVPPARIICMSEAAQELESVASDDPTDIDSTETTDTTSGNAANASAVEVPTTEALPSWEARLKRAIEADASELSSNAEEEAATGQTEQLSAIVPRQVEQSDFEFRQETPPQAETYSPEPTGEQTENIEGEVDATSPSPELFETDLGTPEAPNTTRISAIDDHAALAASLQINSKHQPQKHSWVKIATLAVGTSVVGTLLGLYALLWLRGPSADFAGLANYLPEAMLPATATPPPSATLANAPPPTHLPEETQVPEGPETTLAEQTLLTESQPITETQPLAETTPASTESLRQDEAVHPATAEQPLKKLPATANISARQFSELVSTGRDALPHFIEGDFSTDQSTKRKGQAYMTLCQLAEQFDFTHQPGLAPAAQAEVETAKVLFGQLFTNADAQGDLAKIALRWWEHDRRSNRGILLAGVIQEAQPLGKHTLCYVVPGGQAALNAIPVLVEGPPPVAGSRIGVVGRIAMPGDQQLAGLGIELPQVVVTLHSYEL